MLPLSFSLLSGTITIATTMLLQYCHYYYIRFVGFTSIRLVHGSNLCFRLDTGNMNGGQEEASLTSISTTNICYDSWLQLRLRLQLQRTR